MSKSTKALQYLRWALFLTEPNHDNQIGGQRKESDALFKTLKQYSNKET